MFFLKKILVLAESQEIATYDLGYKLTLKRDTYNVVIRRDAATN